MFERKVFTTLIYILLSFFSHSQTSQVAKTSDKLARALDRSQLLSELKEKGLVLDENGQFNGAEYVSSMDLRLRAIGELRHLANNGELSRNKAISNLLEFCPPVSVREGKELIETLSRLGSGQGLSVAEKLLKQDDSESTRTTLLASLDYVPDEYKDEAYRIQSTYINKTWSPDAIVSRLWHLTPRNSGQRKLITEFLLTLEIDNRRVTSKKKPRSLLLCDFAANKLRDYYPLCMLEFKDLALKTTVAEFKWPDSNSQPPERIKLTKAAFEWIKGNGDKHEEMYLRYVSNCMDNLETGDGGEALRRLSPLPIMSQLKPEGKDVLKDMLRHWWAENEAKGEFVLVRELRELRTQAETRIHNESLRYSKEHFDKIDEARKQKRKEEIAWRNLQQNVRPYDPSAKSWPHNGLMQCYRFFLVFYPDGVYAKEVRKKLDELNTVRESKGMKRMDPYPPGTTFEDITTPISPAEPKRPVSTNPKTTDNEPAEATSIQHKVEDPTDTIVTDSEPPAEVVFPESKALSPNEHSTNWFVVMTVGTLAFLGLLVLGLKMSRNE